MTPNDPLAVPPPASSRVVLAVVGAVSTIVAFVLTVLQSQALGDAPVSMLACGSLLAFVAGALCKARALHLGIAAMGGFPIVAVIDLGLHGGHTLLPFEFALYAVYAGIAVVMANAGRLVSARFAPR